MSKVLYAVLELNEAERYSLVGFAKLCLRITESTFDEEI
jgi:hypothetical protein